MKPFTSSACLVRRMLKAWYNPSCTPALMKSLISFTVNHLISCSLSLKPEWTAAAYFWHTWGRVEVCFAARLHNFAIDLLALCVLILRILLQGLSLGPGWCLSVGQHAFCVPWQRLQPLRGENNSTWEYLLQFQTSQEALSEKDDVM